MKQQTPCDILTRLIHDYIAAQHQKILETHVKCDECGKASSKGRLVLHYAADSPVTLVRSLIKNFKWRECQKGFRKGDGVFILNREDWIVASILNQLSFENYKILCKSCLFQAQMHSQWNKLENPLTSNADLRKIIRTILKHHDQKAILKLCGWLSPHISNRIRKIPRQVRRIWIQFASVAKNFYDNPISRPFLLDWMTQWLNILFYQNFVQTHIGRSIAESIYSIDEPAISVRFFEKLYHNPINLFNFFVTINPNYTNHYLIPFLLKNLQNSESLSLKITDTLQGLICTLQPNPINLILHHFLEFPSPFQNRIIDELFLFAAKSKIYKLILSLQQVVFDQNLEITKSIQSYFTQVHNVYKKEHLKQIASEEEHTNKLHQDEQKIAQYHREWKKKRGPSPVQMSEIKQELIREKYTPIIQWHITRYKDEFQSFFSTHEKPIVAFDVEEWHHQVFCVMGIQVNPDLSFVIKVITVEDIYPINQSHYQLMAQMQEWLLQMPSSRIISHGTNQNEENLIKTGGHFQINTQDILHEARQFSAESAHMLKGEGLKHFEASIQFVREGCSVLKHNPSDVAFFQLCEVSLDHLLSKEADLNCLVCQKPQDVLLYCLEDAFSSLLAYVHYANHMTEICRKLGY
ncbi:MAG: hypothetical protein ACTSWW_06645 [Promethearchaeota archaeon]